MEKMQLGRNIFFPLFMLLHRFMRALFSHWKSVEKVLGFVLESTNGSEKLLHWSSLSDVSGRTQRSERVLSREF